MVQLLNFSNRSTWTNQTQLSELLHQVRNKLTLISGQADLLNAGEAEDMAERLRTISVTAREVSQLLAALDVPTNAASETVI